MSNLFVLAAPSTPVRHPDLGRYGRRLVWLLTGILGLTALSAACVLSWAVFGDGSRIWLAPGGAYLGSTPPDIPGRIPFGALPALTRWAYIATFTLNLSPILLMLAETRACARDFAAGIAFGAAGPSRMRRIALWLIASAITPAVGHALVLLAGHGVDLEWLHASSLQACVLAACLLVLAEVARIGHAIARELDGFV